VKSYNYRSPFLPVIGESRELREKQATPALTKSFVLPRRHADHGRIYIQPPDGVFEAIFEVFPTRMTGNYARPIGAGVLISPSLALMTHSTIPTVEVGARCHLQFINNGEIFKLAPRSHFRTNSALNLTVCAVEPIYKTVRHGVRLRHVFFLQEQSRLYWGSGASGAIEQLDNLSFYFYSSETLLQGTPIFDYNWELVGITLSSVTHVRFNEGRRVDSIYSFVNASSSIVPSTESSPVLSSKTDLFLRQHNYRTVGQQPMRTGLVHWFLWGGRAVMTYDITEHTWRTVTATLTEQVEEHSWCFYPNSRAVVLPDQTLMLIGGSVGTGATSAVMRYYPFQGIVSLVPSMLNARSAAAVCYLNNYVYVIGGLRKSKTAERYSLTRAFWQYILPSNYERFEASAVTHENTILVVGGSATEAAGQTIERYSEANEEWEVLRILLPIPLINPGVCAMSYSRIAILGGRQTRRVFLLQNSYLKSFSLSEAQSFPDDVESVYPVGYFQAQKQLLIFNSSEYKDRPVLIKYSENCFTSGEFMYLE
jgi:hypothetical protein